MSFLNRLPSWFREDPLAETIDIETEFDKVNSYVGDFLSRFVKQPQQIWTSYKPKDFIFTGNIEESIPIDITGSFQANFDFTLEDVSEIGGYTTAVNGPINISDGANTITVNTDLPKLGTLELNPQGRVKVNGQEIFNSTLNSVTQAINDTNIPIGVITGYKKLMQIFKPEVSSLEGIIIKIAKVVGAIDDLNVQLYELSDTFVPTYLIDDYTIPNESLLAPDSDIIIPFNDQLNVTKYYAFIIRRLGPLSNESYFVLEGSSEPFLVTSSYTTLQSWNVTASIDTWVNAINALYFEILTPITEGTLPLINPPIGNITVNQSSIANNASVNLTCVSNNLELDTIYARSTALPIYPLKEMDIVLDGTIIPINVSFYTEDEETTISPDDLKTYYEENLKGIYLLDTLNASITLNDFTNFSNANTVLNIAPRSGLLESGEYTLIFAEGSLTDNDNNPLNYCSIDFVTNGAVEIYDPSGNIDEMVVDRNVLAVVFNEPIQISNLSKIELKYNNGTILKTQTFQKAQKQYCNFMSVSADEIPEGLITQLPFKIYLETSWYGFEQTIKKGFPQDSTDEDNIYWPNEVLDEHATTYGLFRRTYRDDIEPWEYRTTYPVGYPFIEEQDYQVEKRILNEYATRSDKNSFIYLQDGEENNFIELKCKISGISNIEVYGYNDIDGSTKIKATYISKEKVKIIEVYSFIDGLSLTKDINNNSEILSAIYLNNADTLLLYDVQNIITEGIYPTYGLIRSEIHSYLGVIPSIKDMIDYCLVWDKKTWNNYLWSGDIYSQGVFRVDIPFPPSNFVWLTEDEIVSIMNRCKKVGTRALSAYSVESQVSLGEMSINVGAPESIVPISLYLLFHNLFAGMCIFTDPATSCPIAWPLADLIMSLNANISASCVKENESLSMSMGINTIGTILNPDVYITNDFNEDILVNTTIVDNNVELALPGIQNISLNATQATDIQTSNSSLKWSYLSNIAHANNYVVGQTSTISGATTDTINTTNFGFTIPTNAIITGITVTISANLANVGGLETNGYVSLNNQTVIETTVLSGWNRAYFGYVGDWEDNIPQPPTFWGLDGITPEEINDGISAQLYFSPINTSLNMLVDWVYIDVFYQIDSGTITSSRINLIGG